MARRRWGLTVNRYSADGLTPYESFGEAFGGLAVTAGLPGWLQKFQFTIKARNRNDALERERRHMGQVMALLDNTDTVIGRGWVRSVTREDALVTYECTGAWERMRENYFSSVIDPNTTVSAAVDALIDGSGATGYVTSLSANIGSNSAVVGDVGIREIEEGPGVLVAETIEKLLAISDGTSVFDWWVQAAPFVGGYKLGRDIAYYRARPSGGTPDWLVRTRDLLQGSGAIQSHIYDLASSAVVVPGKLTGHAYTGGVGTNALLIDTQEDWFSAYNVQVGDTVINREYSTGSSINYGYVEELTSGSITAPLTNSGGGTNTDWHFAAAYADGDEYEVVLSQPTKGISVAGTTNYWTALRRFEAPMLDQTQAAVLAARILEAYEGPVYQQSVAIGSPYITGANGARYPLWRLLRRPSTLRIQDDTNGTYGDSFDLYGRNGAYLVAVTYDHDQGTASVTPNTFSDTLGALLQRAGVLDGRVIEAAVRPAPGEESGGSPGRKRGPAGLPGPGTGWNDLIEQMPPAIRNNRRLMQKWLEENGYI